jgi:hypothetical protein
MILNIMFKRILFLPVILFIICTNVYAFSVTGSQGYGLFGFDPKHTFGLASIMSAGIRFNEYFEIKYFSVDTSFRMPVLPFRLVDAKYMPFTDSQGRTNYTFFDSDLIGINLSYPLHKYFIPSLYYGIGRGKIFAVTLDNSPQDTVSMTMKHDFIQVLNPSVRANFNITDTLVISPTIGAMFFYMNDNLPYRHAYSYFMAVSVFYQLF